MTPSAARRPQPRRRGDRGRAAGLHDHQRQGLHARPGQPHHAPDQRHLHRALLSRPARLPARGAGALLLLQPDATPTQIPGNVIQAPFQCNIPRAALGTASHIALYGHGLLGSHTQIEEDNIKSMSRTTTSPSAPPTGPAWPPRTSPTREVLTTSRGSRRWPTGSSRASSNAVPRPPPRHPEGFAPTRPSAPTDARCWTRRPVLRRQQPGRDPGRPGHRVAPDWPAACSACRDELPRCCRARRLRQLRRGLRARLSERGPAMDRVRSCRCCRTAARPTAGPST